MSYTEYQDARRAAMAAGLRALNKKNQRGAGIPAGRRSLLREAAEVMQQWVQDLRSAAVAEQEP